ncbi:hypothetical protein DSECCO2_447040 [anaerobic digester metagenome]
MFLLHTVLTNKILNFPNQIHLLTPLKVFPCVFILLKKYQTANFVKKRVDFAILLKLHLNMVVFVKIANHNN